jgi:hypothetical protein
MEDAMRRTGILAAAVLAAVQLAGGTPARASGPIPGFLGSYWWVGTNDGQNSLDVGANGIAGLGGHLMRAVYSSSQCDSNQTVPFDLVARAQQADAVSAFDNPAITTYMLTIVACPASAPSGANNVYYLDPNRYQGSGFTTMHDAYAAFARYLMDTYRNRGKTFIVSNWESDNALYCGSAYAYIVDSAFRSDCDTNYHVKYPYATGVGDTMRGLQLFFDARQSGVTDGRNGGIAAGDTGVAVYNADEINSVGVLSGAGLPSTLYNVLPFLQFPPDFVSYSSYESINLASGESPGSNQIAGRLADAIREIGSRTGRSVIIGEFGYDVTNPSVGGDVGQISLSRQVIDAANADGATYIFNWQLSDDVYGLYSTQGTRRPLGDAFAQWYATG